NSNTEGLLYNTNQTVLDPRIMSFPNTVTTIQPSFTQFASLPPGPYLAPPAMYGKTLEVLAAVSPNFAPFGKPSPSPAMLSPPNLPNNVCYIYKYIYSGLAGLSPPNPNPINQSASNMLLQLSGLNQFANGNTNPSFTGNVGAQATNFANLTAFVPPSSITALQQLSPTWGATLQNLNSVASIPSVHNTFSTTGTNALSSSVHVSKTNTNTNGNNNSILMKICHST
ncbi:hypothetical protein RFI_17631, partial [Reticulomyxa filosa]